MLPLPELQARFAAALRADADAPVDAALLREIRADGVEPAARLDLYRNNLRGNFLKVLALEFPAVRRLGGADWFEQCGLEFLRAHPSTQRRPARPGRAVPGLPRAAPAGRGARLFRRRRRARMGLAGEPRGR